MLRPIFESIFPVKCENVMEDGDTLIFSYTLIIYYNEIKKRDSYTTESTL